MAKNKIKATINADSVNNAPIAVVKVEDTVLLELCVLKKGQLVDFTNQSIYISALRADNSLIQQEVFVKVEKTELMIQLNEKFNQVPGIVRMELTAKDNEGITTTADFYLRVNSRLLNNAIEKGDYIETLDKVKQDFITSSNALIEELKSNSNLTFIEFREQFEELKQEFLHEAEKVREEFRIKGNTTIQAFYNSTQEVLHEFDVLGLQAIANFNTEGNNAIEEVRTRGQAIEDYFRANISNYKGDKGDRGEKGEKGDTGATGLTGAKGEVGATGAPGKDGKDAVVVNSFEGQVDEALSVVKGKELDTRMTQVEDFSMFYQQKEAEGTVTWTNSYIGDIKDLVIKGKTIGGYNSETQQYDTIVSSAEQEGNILKVRTCGKNLLETVKAESTISLPNKPIVTLKTDGSFVLNGRCVISGGRTDYRDKLPTITLKKGKTYTLSAINRDGVAGIYLSRRDDNSSLSTNGSNQYKPTEDIETYFGINYKGDTEYNNLVIKPQLEENTIATSYVPYQEAKAEVQLPCSHLEGNIYSGESGEYVENRLKITLNESVECDITTFPTQNITRLFRVRVPRIGKGDTDVICSHFKSLVSFNRDEEHVYLSSNGGGMLLYFYIDAIKADTIEKFKEWLQANPVTVIYELAEPIEHNIEKLPPLKSYKGTTHITLDNEIKGSISAKVKVDLPSVVTNLETENMQLKKDLDSRSNYFEANDVNLLKNNLEMDFRLMEVEFALDIPINLNMKGGVEMAATPYEMMKKIILSGNYDRADYEYKISVYVKRGRMTQEEANELIALMDANELV